MKALRRRFTGLTGPPPEDKTVAGNGAAGHPPPSTPHAPAAKPLPADNAEAGVLGCVLLKPDLMGDVLASGVAVEAFESQAHRVIFSALQAMQRSNTGIDCLTLHQHLKDAGQLDKAGGLAYLAALPDGVPSAANLAHYIKILLAKSAQRQLITTAQEILDLARSGRTKPDRLATIAVESFSTIAKTLPRKAEIPTIETACALMSDDSAVVPPEIIVGVLHQGLKGILGSASKARKTWVEIDMAVSVANGIKFWKWDTNKNRVLLINLEIPRAFIKQRLREVIRAKQKDNPDVGISLNNLDIWTLRGYASPLSVLAPKLYERIRNTQYGLIIIDPIYKTMVGEEENSTAVIGEMCNQVEQISMLTGAAVVYAAHYSKGNKSATDAIDRISGSGVYGRDADSIICMTALNTPDAYSVDLILRNLPEQPSFAIAWKFPLMDMRADLDPGDLKKVGGRKSDYDDNDVLDLLSKTGLTTTEWQELANEELGMSKSTFIRVKKRLEKSKQTFKNVSDDKWNIAKK